MACCSAARTATIDLALHPGRAQPRGLHPIGFAGWIWERLKRRAQGFRREEIIMDWLPGR
jgi:hypothetical protein